MAPPGLSAGRRIQGGQTDKHGGTGRLQSLISFSQQLQAAISTSFDDRGTNRLLAEIEDHISYATRALSSSRRETLPCQAQLEEHGTDLWNRCIHQRRSEPGDVPQTRRRLALHATTLAFLMLAVHHKAAQAKTQDTNRMLRVGIKAGRHCLDGGEFALADTMVKYAADYIARLRDLQKENSKDNKDIQEYHRLEAEYAGLRIVLSWKREQLEIAEFVYMNIGPLLKSLDVELSERLAEALFEVGSGLLSLSDLPLASKWLDRALEAIDLQPLDQLSREGIELRIAITQAVVQSHIKTNTPESLAKADALIQYLEDEIGERPVVLLMRLELILKSPDEAVDQEAYGSVLKRMGRAFVGSEKNCQLILHHVKRLANANHYLASAVLDEFLVSRLAGEVGKHPLAEKATITRIYITIRSPCLEEAAEDLAALFDQLRGQGFILGPDAAMAGQSLMWHVVDKTSAEKKLELAETWCRLCLHEIFRNTGPSNAAKIARKMMACSLTRNDTNRVKDIFQEMQDTTRNEPETRYLLYKTALQIDDQDLAQECLEYIGNGNNDQLLYACATDAGNHGKKLCALRALKKLVMKYDLQTSGLNIQTLLRCTVRLNVVLLKEGGRPDGHPGMIDDLCETYENAAAYIQQAPVDSKGNKVFTIEELDWFCKNAYNTVLQHMFAWTTGYSLRLLGACLIILSRYPDDLPQQDVQELSLKTAFCHFLGASLRLVAARVEDDVERQLQHYLEARKHINSYDNILQSGQISQMGEEATQDLNAKLVTLFVFDFEAAITLKSYDDLGQIVRRSRGYGDLAAYQAMGDALLGAKLPGNVLTATMRVVVNEIWKLEQFDMAKMAKYTRCMFQAALPLGEDAALGIVDHCVETFARQQGQGGLGYPNVELQWMAAVSFNHGLDLYGVGEVQMCRSWAERALNLAELVQDGGAMRQELHGKWSLLSWEKE